MKRSRAPRILAETLRADEIRLLEKLLPLYRKSTKRSVWLTFYRKRVPYDNKLG